MKYLPEHQRPEVPPPLLLLIRRNAINSAPKLLLYFLLSSLYPNRVRPPSPNDASNIPKSCNGAEAVFVPPLASLTIAPYDDPSHLWDLGRSCNLAPPQQNYDTADTCTGDSVVPCNNNKYVAITIIRQAGLNLGKNKNSFTY